MKKILVIGATSAIAEAVCRIWAQRGDELFLVARNQEKLNAITKDLNVRGSQGIYSYCMDVNSYEEHLPMITKAFDLLGEINIVLIAHGTLAVQKECEHSVELTLREIKTNALSTIVLLTNLANRFEIQRGGTIAVISSVAGDRGRASNYVYGSAKAMITTFASGLRQRLYKSGVSVVTIKPGFVDTPMTTKFNKGVLWVGPAVVAVEIVKAVDKKKSEVYIPKFWWGVMAVIKLLPASIFRRLDI